MNKLTHLRQPFKEADSSSNFIFNKMKFDLILGLIAAYIDAFLLACKFVAVIALGSVSVSQALPQTCCGW